MVGIGKIQVGKPKSENREPKSRETVEIDESVDDATDANDEDGNNMLQKLKPTIDMIQEMVSGESEIKLKEFTEL